jgi:hypothetical protein
METKKFYNFNQNNSGGYFVDDEKYGVGEYVIIEASNAEEAWDKLESIGSNVSGFWNYCGCCGERWSNWLDDEDGKERPEIYGVPIDEVKRSMFRNEAYVHYTDGTFKKYKFTY